jgi:hypothetical protein
LWSLSLWMVGLWAGIGGLVKLRIRGNSVRFRLTRGEVDELSREGSVRATVSFPGGASLEYALETSSMTGQPRANYSSDRLVVQIPQAEARQWAQTEQVSISAAQPLGDGDRSLSILVEKDFACLAPREGEDDTDMFPHPLEGQET